MRGYSYYSLYSFYSYYSSYSFYSSYSSYFLLYQPDKAYEAYAPYKDFGFSQKKSVKKLAFAFKIYYLCTTIRQSVLKATAVETI
jgi:hypothetical protein